MATIKTDLICNLNQPVNVTYLHGNLFSQDNAGNTINVFVMDNGEPATIGGTVSANVIRSDGQTVAVSGAIEGNKAYVILPQACYAVPGVVHIIIKLTQNTTITTIAAIVANVYMSTTDAVIDPGTVIPSIQALMALIEEAVDSIPTDYTGLLHTIAADYSSSKTYKVGDYAWESGVLKRCIVPITAAETYTAAHWTNAVIGDDLTNLKSAIPSLTGGDVITSWILKKRIKTNDNPINYNSPSSTTLSYACIVVDCVEGDVFTIIGENSNSGYQLWCFCTDAGVLVSCSTGTNAYNGEEIIAPTNATKLICNVNSAVAYQLVRGRIVKNVADNAERAVANIDNLLDLCKKTDKETSGITFAWDGNSCKVSGTASGTTSIDIYRNINNLPVGMEAGKPYRIIQESDNVQVRVIWYDLAGSDTLLYGKNGAKNETITIPATAKGLTIRLQVTSGAVVDETVSLFIFKEQDEMTKYAGREMIGAASIANKELLRTFKKANKSSSGVDYTWNSVDNSCHVEGETTGTSFCVIYRDTDAMPVGFVAGGKYIMQCVAAITRLRVIWYDGEGADTLLAETNGSDPVKFTIPNDAAGLSIRLNITSSGVAVNEIVYPQIYEQETEAEKALNRMKIGAAPEIAGGIVATNANLLAVGNSFMSGAVYINGHNDHSYSAYPNTVYGNIAMALCVPEQNVTFQLHSSSGIINKSDGKNLADIIKTYDLSDYDYVITGMSGTDMTNYQLGDANATADDGTIAGAVVGLLENLTASNGMCKLILLSVPPYSSQTDRSGANVFTGQWPNGKSIGDTDELMFALAKKYHFTFISWQDNPMSYHYMDFADYIGPNEGSRHANSENTYRAMGEYAAMQMMAVNSPIALKLIAGLT